MYNFGAGQENCGCKCTHCTHKFGALNDIKYFLKESINHWNGIEIYYRFILSFFDHFPLKYFSNFSFWSLSFFSFMSFSFDFFKNFISWAFSFWSFSYQGHFHGHPQVMIILLSYMPNADHLHISEKF